MTLCRKLLLKLHVHRLHRCYSSSNKDIRNIGILAHIDAGKTTTTERMLFYAGKTHALGEVHRGNTVTDFMTQERERGITICSSAVTFPWQQKKINLLDTPGHIDFTMEVEQSLYAVDGVIVVLDATAGVEAQTMTVWEQAARHALPKLVFVNKMDRPDADFDNCLLDLRNKLGVQAIALQRPQKDAQGNLSIVDLVQLQHCVWNAKTQGRDYQYESIAEKSVQQQRCNIIDQLAGIDDQLAEVVIATESFEQVPNELLLQAIRRATHAQKVVPVLCGSAYKNVGIQKLLDAICHYLPAPHERNHLYDCFGDDFVAKVFKITHDKQRGPLSLLRIYRGSLKKGMRLTSTRGNAEVVSRIYEPLADEYREINEVAAGDVCICSGLKHTVTGDLLSSSGVAFKNAQKRLQKLLNKETLPLHKLEKEEVEEEQVDTADLLMQQIFSLEPKIPDAVYFCAIEPPSLSAQAALEVALQQLQREDPSLRVSYDAETGQTVLGGMGELHMDIIKSRILSEYKIAADLGPLQIAYKETIEHAAMASLSIEKDIAGNKQSVNITLELLRNQKELFSLDKSPENVASLNHLRPRVLLIIRKGAISALERGPRVGGQLVDTQIKLHNAIIGRGTADAFLMAAAAQCVQKILNENGTRLLEPIMALQIVAPSERISAIIADLSRRRAEINNVLSKGERNKLIMVNAPLSELTGYSSILRAISSGTASMTMQPCGFANMNANDELLAIRRAQGFE